MDQPDDLDLFAALALDALDETERAGAERFAAEHPETAEVLHRYREAAALMGAAASAAPPADLARRIAARATAARTGGVPTGPWAAPDITAAEGFARAVGTLDDLLSALSSEQWAAPVAEYPGWTVADVVAHLVGVDRIMGGLLGFDDTRPAPGTEHDHRASTRSTQDELAGTTPTSLLATWRRHSQALADHVSEHWSSVAAEEIAVPSLIPLPVETVLVARIFEVWTHSEDICRAVGRSLVGVDPSMLRLMCPVAIAAVPYGLLMAGRPGSGRTARVVLTGPGGGAWTQALGLGDVPDEIDALVIADALGFCRLAAQRLSPAELGHHVDGDGEVAAAVLVGAAMFAA